MESVQSNSRRGIDSFWLKIAAIIGMTLDHIGIIFGSSLTLPVKIAFYAPGGLTFPIMAFLLVEGYRHTSNVKRYALRLLLFAGLSQIPFHLAFKTSTLNVMFTLLTGLVTIWLHDHMKSRLGFKLCFVVLIYLSVFMDWTLVGVPMILCYHVIRDKWRRLIIPIILAYLMFAVPPFALLFSGSYGAFMRQLPSIAFIVFGSTATIALLGMYNGQRGRSMKYFFYLYYPLHLLLLFGIKYLFFGG